MASAVDTVGGDVDASEASAEPNYLQDQSESLQASTDMVVVVEGTALPCHRQIMALHSKVFAGMMDMTSGHEFGTGALQHTLHMPPHGLCHKPDLQLQQGCHCAAVADVVMLGACSCRQHAANRGAV